jgi:o-succinylbenzoate synthase
MPLSATYRKHTLQFKFEAGTSRGVLTARDTYLVHLTDPAQPGKVGVGEAGPLKGLSIDDVPCFEDHLREVCRRFPARFESITEATDDPQTLTGLVGEGFPALQFAFETALLDLRHGGRRVIFPGPFPAGDMALPINGLIWMGPAAQMRTQIEEKLVQGYTCLKMKIGAIDFAAECDLLAAVRDRFPPEQITLRVDANGAFSPEEAPGKLDTLSRFGLHSIEQPIRAGQPAHMARLCRESPVPVALDEELIGMQRYDDKRDLLTRLRPPFIILKPTLLGGFAHCREWIELAEGLGIGWWMTSALESNVGLNAISQFTASLHPTLPQGLGTGQLYHNNIPSPLRIQNGHLHYDPGIIW